MPAGRQQRSKTDGDGAATRSLAASLPEDDLARIESRDRCCYREILWIGGSAATRPVGAENVIRVP